jgi:hypothetical protein
MLVKFGALPKSIGIRADTSLMIGFHELFRATWMMGHELVRQILKISVESGEDPHDALAARTLLFSTVSKLQQRQRMQVFSAVVLMFISLQILFGHRQA